MSWDERLMRGVKRSLEEKENESWILFPVSVCKLSRCVSHFFLSLSLSSSCVQYSYSSLVRFDRIIKSNRGSFMMIVQTGSSNFFHSLSFIRFLFSVLHFLLSFHSLSSPIFCHILFTILHNVLFMPRSWRWWKFSWIFSPFIPFFLLF